jgi:hypothetical protein
MSKQTDLEKTHFLNVDLDIHSSSDLQPLVSTLGEKVIALYVGRERRTYSAHLELARLTQNADSTIRRFCALIESPPKAARKLWNNAKNRDFQHRCASGAAAELVPVRAGGRYGKGRFRHRRANCLYSLWHGA